MSSAPAPVHDEDRTARARIRDWAIVCFAAQGVAGTSLKVIAEHAGVSAPLVVHHFGSKQELRVACDEHVAATIREQKLAAMAQGPHLDPLAAMRNIKEGQPVLRYLARTLSDGSPEVVALLDEMLDDALDYMEEGERSGILKPSEHPRGRAVVLMMWSLGALTMHEHINRLLGVDLTGDADDLLPYLLPSLEILAKGVMAEGIYEHFQAELKHPKEEQS